jgi:chromosome partitioning protein
MTEIVTFANQSGGCGKTTSTTSLAAVVSTRLPASAGRVLVIDADLQCDTSHYLGYSEPDELDGQANLNDVLAGDTPISEAIVKTELDRVDLVLGSQRLAAAEKNLASDTGGEFRLRTALQPVLDDYAVILVDSPASLGVLAVNIFVAANHVVACVKPGLKEIRALVNLDDTVRQVNARIRIPIGQPELHLSGILICDTPTYRTGKIYQDAAEYCRQLYGERVLPEVPRDVRAAESYANRVAMPVYAPTGKASKAYGEVTTAMARVGIFPPLEPTRPAKRARADQRN